jgi:glutaminase
MVREEVRIMKTKAHESSMKQDVKSDIPSPVTDYLRHLHRVHAEIREGKVATYIPELAKADPNWFGICLVTASGAVYEAGDTSQPFTIQSISKPFVYGLALEDNGRLPVFQKVGVEPTGDAFNSISLDPGTGRPRNPMINAGAIATAGLIAGKTAQVRLKRVTDSLGLYAGRELTLDKSVYRSESDTGHRNRAIGHMLRNFDILTSDPMPVVELYFQQCSISVTCRDLGVMAATLGNSGVNPITGKQAIRGEYVESVLSTMGSCGMYDYAGEWIYNVGMPAKSGVSGGIIAVLPGQLGIGVFSPLLDEHGNSVRGIRICQELSRHLNLHLFNRPAFGKFIIRLKFSGAELNSSRVRTAEESQVLRESGDGIKVYQLQGHLNFTTTEIVVRDVFENVAAIDYLLLDLKRVLSIDESACRLLYESILKLSGLGKHVLFAHVERAPLLRRYMKVKLAAQFTELFRAFDDMDPALEWCENRVLEAGLPGWSLDRRMEPERCAFFEGLNAAEIRVIRALLQRQRYQRGENIIRMGEEAREMFFIVRGSVSVTISMPSGAERRLATFSAGMVFGEMAVIDGAPRSARIVADSEVECDLLTVEDFDRLGVEHPAIKIKLLENLCLGFCHKLRRANRQMNVLE